MGVAVLLAPCVVGLRVGAVSVRYGQVLVVVTGELVNVVNIMRVSSVVEQQSRWFDSITRNKFIVEPFR